MKVPRSRHASRRAETPGRGGRRLVGVDVGGTFTDVVTFDVKTGALEVLKFPTTEDPSDGISKGLQDLGLRGRLSLLSHATTMATNALLTHAGLARTALITNEGFRDVLEIGRQRRPELYDLKTRRPVPIVRRRDRLTVRCRTAADGSVLEPLSEDDARSVSRTVVSGGFESVAVCFLNSYVGPDHERQMSAALRREGYRGHISLSCDVDREYREFERTSTTVVNAALAPKMAGYLFRLQASLRRVGIGAPFYVMNSDGGMSTAATAAARPVTTIESGPAAGVVASSKLARSLGLGSVLTFDMGGTTAKACTVTGSEPDVTREFEAAGRTHSGRSIRGSGYVVRGSFIDVAEVSAGGGTMAWLDETGRLQMGPESAGSDPGPACYGRGGVAPTVTDANLVTGRLSPTGLLGGRMRIDRKLGEEALERLAARSRLSALELAKAMVRLANDEMVRAISIVSVERGKDPREFTMIAFGGAGPMHACDLAEEMEMREVVVPAHAGLFSAYGLIVGDLTRTFISPAMGPPRGLGRRFARLDEEAREAMEADGLKRYRSERFIEARYAGQSHELRIPYGGETNVRQSFDARHRELYGYSSPDQIQVVNIGIRTRVPRSFADGSIANRHRGPDLPAAPAVKRAAWIGGETREVGVARREELELGDRGRGPCIIEEYDSTLVVNPSWNWTAERYGVRLSR